MTRGPRRRSESDIYHVVSRGVGHCIIFEDEADRLRFLGELTGVRPSAVAGLGREARDEAVRKLRAAGLSVRQVERLTGVSRGVVAKIR